jgi:hypothetical protein
MRPCAPHVSDGAARHKGHPAGPEAKHIRTPYLVQ